MRQIYRYFIAAFVAVAAISCAKQETGNTNQEQAQGKTYEYVLNVSQEVTKTSMDGKSILWNEGDKIGIVLQDADGQLSGATNAGAQTLTDGAGTTVAKFNLVIPEDCTPFAAVYPYQGGITAEDDNANKVPPFASEISARFYIPAQQYGVLNSLPIDENGDAAFPMVGSIVNGACRMYNAGALIKFTITREDIKSLTFAGNNEEPISGRNYYYVNSGVFRKGTSSSATSVTLLPSADQEVFAPGDYYFAVAPLDLTQGFTMTLTNSEGEVAVKKYEEQFKIERNHKYTNFGSDEGWTFGEGDNGETDEPEEPAVPSEPRTLTLTFADGVETMWPFSKSFNAEISYGDGLNGPYPLKVDNSIEYYFKIKKSVVDESWYQTKAQGLRFGGTKGDYMLLPAIPGYKLTYVKIVAGSKKATYCITTDSDDDAQTIGTDKELQDKTGMVKEGEWNLTETSVNTAYRLLLSSKNASSIMSLTTTYTPAQ